METHLDNIQEAAELAKTAGNSITDDDLKDVIKNSLSAYTEYAHLLTSGILEKSTISELMATLSERDIELRNVNTKQVLATRLGPKPRSNRSVRTNAAKFRGNRFHKPPGGKRNKKKGSCCC